MTKPGFIQHPWTHQRGDSMSAACVIEHIENEAMHGCGLYYEIYHYRVTCRMKPALKKVVSVIPMSSGKSTRATINFCLNFIRRSSISPKYFSRVRLKVWRFSGFYGPAHFSRIKE